MIVYSIASPLAAIGEIIVTSRLDSAQPNAGISYELSAIAAVVIGSTSLSCGRAMIMNIEILIRKEITWFEKK